MVSAVVVVSNKYRGYFNKAKACKDQSFETGVVKQPFPIYGSLWYILFKIWSSKIFWLGIGNGCFTRGGPEKISWHVHVLSIRAGGSCFLPVIRVWWAGYEGRVQGRPTSTCMSRDARRILLEPTLNWCGDAKGNEWRGQLLPPLMKWFKGTSTCVRVHVKLNLSINGKWNILAGGGPVLGVWASSPRKFDCKLCLLRHFWPYLP